MTETKPTTTSEPVSDTDYAEQMLAGKHHRGNGPQMAAFLRLVADRIATADPAVVAHLDINVLPSNHREVDVLAAAFGVEAETRQLGSGSYHRSAKAGPFHVFTSCPPPVTVQREQLLAQLADLDAQIADEAKPKRDILTHCNWIGGCDEPLGEDDGSLLCKKHPTIDEIVNGGADDRAGA